MDTLWRLRALAYRLAGTLAAFALVVVAVRLLLGHDVLPTVPMIRLLTNV